MRSEPWICCQIGAREHYALARALHRRAALELLVTDAWVKPGSPLGMLKSGLRSRYHAELAAANVDAPTLRCVGFEARARLAGLRDWPMYIARNKWFQRLAVSRLSRVAAAASATRTVVSYSYAARDIFKFARSQGWRTVLAQIDPGPAEQRIVAKLYADAPPGTAEWRPAPASYWSDWREECALADRIVVNSAWSRAALVAEGMSAEKLRVVPLAYDAPDIAAATPRTYPPAFTPVRPLRVLFLGQVNLRKGLGPLLDAIRALRGEPIEFTLVGPIQMSIPADLAETPNVRWIGSVPHNDAARFYRNADVFLFPTFSDGFGLTQLEAQAWRLPVIASKCCGDVVEDGKNGWLLPDVTAISIAETLRRCLSNPAQLQELSASCVAGERFDLGSIGERWLRIFDQGMAA